jgi:hypothetical protein
MSQDLFVDAATAELSPYNEIEPFIDGDEYIKDYRLIDICCFGCGFSFGGQELNFAGNEVLPDELRVLTDFTKKAMKG